MRCGRASLHANLFLIFWFLLSRRQDSYAGTAHAIWGTIQNDSTQREMLLNVIDAELMQWKTLHRRARWLVQTTNRLSTYRNIAAHTATIFSHYTDIVPTANPTATKIPTLRRFNQIKHEEFWHLLTGDLTALSHYAFFVAFEIHRPGKSIAGEPLPHKPRLRSLAQIDQMEGQIGRLAQSEAQRLQRSSSRRKRKAP
jgi:hypothetical protein